MLHVRLLYFRAVLEYALRIILTYVSALSLHVMPNIDKTFDLVNMCARI